jgi:uncharacterized protein with PIN domain
MHESLIAELNLECDRVLARIDRLKRYLTISVQLAEKEPNALHFLMAESRGAAVVGTCAELEALTRTVLQRTHEEISSRGLVYRQLSATLRQVAAHDVFESLRAIQDYGKLWERKGICNNSRAMQ